MTNKNHIDPHALADHCEGMIEETILQILRDQLYELFPNIADEDSSRESEIINQAYGYLITEAFNHETNNYDGKN